jgi:hypothetical protein
MIYGNSCTVHLVTQPEAQLLRRWTGDADRTGVNFSRTSPMQRRVSTDSGMEPSVTRLAHTILKPASTSGDKDAD